MDNENALQALAEVLMPVMESMKGRQYATTYKHDTSGVPSANIYSHGPGGLLTFPGVDPMVFYAGVGAKSLLSQLPAVPSLYTDPTYFTMTGVQLGSGSEKDDVCDDAPTAGLIKGCLQTAPFGRYERATQQIEVNRLGQRVDRADPMDLRLVNDPVYQRHPLFNAGVGDPSVPGDLFTNEVSRKFYELGVEFHRLIGRQLWRGTPTNNAGAGGYKELTGIPYLVNTGYVDAETGNTCPSMDSIVRNFGYGRLDLATGASSIVAQITDIWYQLRDRAERGGVRNVRWVIAMKPQMFYELTAVWPCSYLTFRCLGATTSTPLQMDARDAVRFRDEMRAGMYLLIDGERVEVVTDDWIPEDSNTTNGNVPSGCFGSSIYFLPMSVMGQSTLFLEYFQYQNPSIQDAMNRMVLGRIEGAFISWPRQTNLCVQWQSKIEPRLVLRTPWLAARLQQVVYCPIQHTVDEFPSDPYHVDGGKTFRSGPSFYSVWKSNPATVEG